MHKHKKNYKRIALILSLCAIVIWTALGTGTSLAWFTDTDEELQNIFHFADFELKVEYREDDGSWKDIEGETKIFDNEALYEPGYVQVVYLRVKNLGDIPFEFKTAVNLLNFTRATNYFGQTFNLQDYLRFGLVTATDEAAMDAAVSERDRAAAIANEKLNNYESATAYLDAEDTAYIALVVRMPEEVGNDANYRGDVVPKVELGIIVEATQIR